MSLYRFAKLLEVKYLTKKAVDAESMRSQIEETIKQAIANAASWGQKVHGIMPFMQMIQQDGVTLTLQITKSGKDIPSVTVNVSNPALASKYQALSQQVKNYLEKNWELFPSRSNGDSVDYGTFVFQVSYDGAGNSVAAN